MQRAYGKSMEEEREALQHYELYSLRYPQVHAVSCAPFLLLRQTTMFLISKNPVFYDIGAKLYAGVCVPLWVLLSLNTSAQKKHSYHSRTHSFLSYFFPHCFLTYFIFHTLAPVPFSHESLSQKVNVQPTLNPPFLSFSTELPLYLSASY